MSPERAALVGSVVGALAAGVSPDAVASMRRATTRLAIRACSSSRTVGAKQERALAEALATAHVLVVEDDPLVRLALVESVRAAGHHAHQAETLARALELVGRVDAAIVDLGLSDAGGDEATRAMRDADPGLVIVAYTGSPPGHALPSGADAELVKGEVGIEAVVRIVRHVLIQRAASS